MGKKKRFVSTELRVQPSLMQIGDMGLLTMAYMVHPICLSINIKQTSQPQTLPRRP